MVLSCRFDENAPGNYNMRAVILYVQRWVWCTSLKATVFVYYITCGYMYVRSFIASTTNHQISIYENIYNIYRYEQAY